MSATRIETWQSPATRPASVGQSIPRKEDGRLLKGQGQFADDVWMHRMGHVHFVRSPYAHAEIVDVDVSKALAVEGVYATLTGEEVRQLTDRYTQIAPEPGGRAKDFAMAVGKVRYQGEPVAAVLAESRELARDAAALVEVEYARLPHVLEAVQAADDESPRVHTEMGSNVGWHGVYDFGDVDWAIERADHVVRIPRLHFHRFSSTPLECNAAVVNWDPGTGTIQIDSNNQMPQFAALFMAPALGVRSDQLMFRSQDIGGAFGLKLTSYTYLTALALLSRKAGRPAKWTEYRHEHLIGSCHGNERTFLDIEVPVMADGEILGFKANAFDDVGAFMRYEPLGGVIFSQVLPGCYRFKHLQVDYKSVVTNKTPVGPNRGYSRLQHLWLVERIVDLVAAELRFDPVELRKRNYIRRDEFPYTTPNGCVYDSGDYHAMLDRALELVDAPRWRAAQQAAEGTGKRIGIGIGSTLDSGTSNFGQARIINKNLPFSGNGEAAICKIDLQGEISVALGTVPQGQSHETTTAQVVADVLGVTPGEVLVRPGADSARNAYVAFSGTYASQFAVTGIGAALGAAERVKADLLTVAAAVLESTPDELLLVGGTVSVEGDEDRALTFAEIANYVYANQGALPPEVADAVTLNHRHVYRAPFGVPDWKSKSGSLTLTYASQIHVCVVEIDEETGQTRILDYSAVDECGTPINPQVVEGQVHGAAAHGIAAALQETLDYDEDGQLLNGTFWDYHVVSCPDTPMFKTDNLPCPSPFTPTGSKGMGEGGGAPLHAVCSALQDALRDTGAVVTDSHNPTERVWRLLNGDERAADGGRGIAVTSR
ncbi:xanthine dehydrogenase family protein molybdopterin-binding subunit [Conexibacter stalactiti]|uniref:Xanthine dehydrogenase family protein molybdopterin-binding subunit n=1 Tax=Conexibacter stalactiti TaxID=1940611 RepID=A0ABU4I0P1_9ACTN|nr:xanthine dehydrogenase family protein molybdopterin-binding subunit [Conexibacter stalactiti]MDW5597889.1 xanthine dehydrogenase family protein molybdopterin-binding subunit [Conexibacter stalactiti]MEC5038531.1 xanthine dehydrogenase family protein molybdopterin-binding subunit [Conexibacter stalactiti]